MVVRQQQWMQRRNCEAECDRRALDAPHGKEWVHVDVLPSVLMPRKMRATTGGLVEKLFEKTNERVDSHG